MIKNNLKSTTIAIIGLTFFGLGFVFQGTNEVFPDLSKILGLILIIVGAIGIFRKKAE